MKSRGLSGKGLGGGFKAKAKTAEQRREEDPDGFSRSRTGRLRVRDRAYMSHLHARQEPPLELGLPTEQTGVLELHHTKNPSGAKRRDCDATVVPLDRADHQFVELNPVEERALQRIFSAWSAFRYWCWKKGRSGTPEDALAFQAWVLAQLEREEAHGV